MLEEMEWNFGQSLRFVLLCALIATMEINLIPRAEMTLGARLNGDHTKKPICLSYNYNGDQTELVPSRAYVQTSAGWPNGLGSEYKLKKKKTFTELKCVLSTCADLRRVPKRWNWIFHSPSFWNQRCDGSRVQLLFQPSSREALREEWGIWWHYYYLDYNIAFLWDFLGRLTHV